MPCEECNAEFSLFLSKYRCSNCKRYFCQTCLRNLYGVNLTSSVPLLPFGKPNYKEHLVCALCFVLSRRPLHYSDLLKVKTKHLNFYLQKRKIPTTGCVEKDDLIKLVLRDVQQKPTQQQNCTSPPPQQQQRSEVGNPANGSENGAREARNTFSNIRQTCQKFFNNLSDNLNGSTSSSSSTSGRSNRKTRNNNHKHYKSSDVPNQPGLICEIQVREIPSYSANSKTISQQENSNSANRKETNNNIQQNREELEALQHSLYVNLPPETIENVSRHQSSSSLSSITSDICRCPDYNLFEEFQQYRDEARCPRLNEENNFPNMVPNQNGDSLLVIDSGANSLSWHSSFEELGAVGGIEESKQNNLSGDVWQLVNLPDEIEEKDKLGNNGIKDRNDFSKSEQQQDRQQSGLNETSASNKHRYDVNHDREGMDNVDGYNHEHIIGKENHNSDLEREKNNYISHVSMNTSSCKHCGKNRTYSVCQNLEKLRQHLLDSKMNKTEIDTEVRMFHEFLERRNISTAQDVRLEDVSDHEDDESHGYSRNVMTQVDLEITTDAFEEYISEETASNTERNDIEIEDINEKDTPEKTQEDELRCKMLDEYKSLTDLEILTVKELKNILMINRVDYRGCCEKQELLERVKRLWKEYKSTPCVDKLAANELCKICMDAPLECVVLECGHMATCTRCAKVLSECPICRQYIVRVVRFFRA